MFEDMDPRDAVIEHLLAHNLVSREAVARAEAVALRSNQPVETVLNSLGELSDADLAATYVHISRAPLWSPEAEPSQLEAEDIGVGEAFLRKVRVVPLKFEEERLCIAVCDPFDLEMIEGLKFATGRDLSLRIARLMDVRSAFDVGANGDNEESIALDESRLERDLAHLEDHGVAGQAVDLVAQAFAAAVERGASDIHFEPRRHDLKIRLRIDGHMIDYATVPADVSASCVSRIKVLAHLNVAERRLPQDGRASFINAGRAIDVRVATTPTVFGEGATLRLLDRTQAPQDMEALGLSPQVTEILNRALKTPHGLFLVTGPTGSGKTTTLYALLAAFKGTGKKILSVEDPVERHFDHVSQTQVQPQIGLDFATCLRSFLRHDPDIILVGEIRDRETAQVAVQAAMTGHLVLASVHANTAIGIAPRLIDMGIEPYQLAASLKGTMAQRLVRKLCLQCRASVLPSGGLKAFAEGLGIELPELVYEAKGCAQCRHIGYTGRLAMAEGFWADDDLLARIGSGASLDQLKSHAEMAGLVTMKSDGLRLIKEGLTTFEEVMRVTED